MPERMRDFHEQKSLFKAMHIAYREDYPNNERIPPWTSGMIYVIDWFLWFMGSRGYTLQKNRSKLDFLDYPEYNGEVKLEKPFTPDEDLDKDREILFLKEHISDLSYCLKRAVELRGHSCSRCDSGQCHTQEKEDTLWGYSVPMALSLTKTADETSYDQVIFLKGRIKDALLENSVLKNDILQDALSKVSCTDNIQEGRLDRK